jgi:murein DD-endopeptidase MepM/ murein hydrolase activator NlpD
MGKRHHTVIFVPHARARLRKWRVTDTQIRVTIAVALLLSLASAFIAWQYFTSEVDVDRLAQLRQENEDLRRVNESFETNIRDLQTKLADFEDRTLQLAIIAGLDPSLSGNEAGVGGETLLAVSRGDRLDLGALETRTGQLDEALDQVETRLEERLRWISATPAIAPAKGILTSGFGIRRDPMSGIRAFHQGVDIAASPGQEVRAAADGIVVRAGRMGSLGKAVYLAHGFGITTRYGHMAELSVEPGQKVERGDVVGRVGSTGRSTGYHLHYEVWIDGSPVDPLAYIFDTPPAR